MQDGTSVFLAYPSESQIADSMGTLATILRSDLSLHVATWEDLNLPGLIFPPIATAIESASVLVAEITTTNPNVLFELGYAIGLGRHVIALRDTNRASFNLPPLLDTLRRLEYSSRQDILDQLVSWTLPEVSLRQELGLTTLATNPGTLYYIPSRLCPDVTNALWRSCQESVFDVMLADPNDTEYDNLTSQLSSIVASDVVITSLLSDQTRDYERHNAHVLFLAGFALGMGKQLAVVAQQPLRRILDLGDLYIRAETETSAARSASQWLQRTAKIRVKNPVVRRTLDARKSNIDGLFLGSLDARSDFQLNEHFLITPEFRQAESGQRSIFVGSKGAGKTAIFERLRNMCDERNEVMVAVWPAEFEFPRLAAIFDELSDHHWRFVYGSFWRYIFITEILKALRDKFSDHLLRYMNRPAFDAIRKWIDEHHDMLELDFVSRCARVATDINAIVSNTDQERREAIENKLESVRMYDMPTFETSCKTLAFE